MAEAKGLSKPVKLKKDLAELLEATELPRTEITKKLWDYSEKRPDDRHDADGRCCRRKHRIILKCRVYI